MDNFVSKKTTHCQAIRGAVTGLGTALVTPSFV
jgi:hypothetical protein